MQLHGHNHSCAIGVRDSSGMVFTYSSMKRQHDAGILTIGHTVSSRMVIPPRAVNYTVSGYCSGTCTQQVRNSFLQATPAVSLKIAFSFYHKTESKYLQILYTLMLLVSAFF